MIHTPAMNTVHHAANEGNLKTSQICQPHYCLAFNLLIITVGSVNKLESVQTLFALEAAASCSN